MRAILLLALVLVAIVPCAPVGAQDQDEEAEERHDAPRWRGWGIRLGVADDPDQVVLGAQFDFGNVARRLYMEPNIELGVGDDHTILSTTGALHYRFRRKRSVRPHIGAGLTLGLVRFDPPNNDSDTDLEIALELIGGVSWTLKSRRELFLEAALIGGDLQDAQLVVGFRF